MTAPTMDDSRVAPPTASTSPGGVTGNLIDVENLKVYFPIRAGMF